MATRRLLAVAGIVLLACGLNPAHAQSYRTYSEIGQLLQDAANDYPDLCAYHVLGTSVQGREIRALNISDNVGVQEDEPEFKYVSTMHGNEWVGNEMLLYLIDHMLSNYGTDPQVTELIDEVDIWLVPLMNPDGYVLNQRYNASGYDLNRSFPDPFTSPNNTPTGRPTEVGVIMNWSFGHTFTHGANMHTGELVVNYPYDNNPTGSSVYTACPDDDLFIVVSKEYSRYNLPMWNSSYFLYGITNGADWYAIDGGMQDWNYRYMGCNAVTLELSTSFAPPASQIPTYWDNNRQSMLHYMATCLWGVRGLVTGPGGTPLACTVTVEGRDHEIYTDPDVGDYHRMLLPGVYDLTFTPDSYPPQTIYDVVVTEGDATRLDVSYGPEPPVCYDVEAQGEAGFTLPIMLDGSDPNSDPLDYIIVSLPSAGTLSDPWYMEITAVPYTLLNNGSQVNYDPDPGYVGPDSFQYKVNDGGTPPDGGDSNTSTASINIIAAAPTITTTTLPDGIVDFTYEPVQLEASGGQTPLDWSIVTGTVYSESDLGSNQFVEVGVAQGWHGDDDLWAYDLPFTFPFYGTGYDAVRVCANGWLDFGYHIGSTATNSTSMLQTNEMIAPLWDDLRTDSTAYDIYIDESVADEVTIRWDARTYWGGYQVNFSVTLVDDGTIRFHYGSGNTGLTPTVGISKGGSVEYVISMYNGAGTLANVNSVEFSLPTGLPAGMEFSDGGVLSGKPTETGTFEAQFRVTDDLDRSDDQTLSLTVHATAPVDCDYDEDGDVDLADFSAFQACFGLPAAGQCGSAFEFVQDGTIGLTDYIRFEAQLAGPQ